MKMRAINTKPFLSPADLEEMGLWKANRIRQKVHNGTMPIDHFKLDKEIRFKRKDLENYLETRRISKQL